MKRCTKCLAWKSADSFNLERGKPRSYCKVCHVAMVAEWREKNKEKVNAAVRDRRLRWRALNPSKAPPPAKTEEERLARRRAARKRWAEANKAKNARAKREWHKKHADASRAICRAYQAAKRKALPPWADRAKIKAIYANAASRGMEVDHIVPLVSPLVCGLHWEQNLQVIQRQANILKSNKVWPDMP